MNYNEALDEKIVNIIKVCVRLHKPYLTVRKVLLAAKSNILKA